jgi:predicted nicotinamide N-methyase
VNGDQRWQSDFVRRETRVQSCTLVPELRLHLADRMLPIWEATEAALASAGISPPFWAFAWPGSQALARFLCDGGLDPRGRSVLDLACGCGLAAIAAARHGALATANDIDPLALAAVRLNAGLNGTVVATDGRDLLCGRQGEWDIILVGDVFYERGLAERAAAWLRRHAEAGTDVLIGDPGRSYLPSTGLAPVATYCVATDRDLEDSDVKQTTIYRLV